MTEAEGVAGYRSRTHYLAGRWGHVTELPPMEWGRINAGHFYTWSLRSAF